MSTALARRDDLATVLLRSGDLVEDVEDVFEDVAVGPVAALLAEYEAERAKAERIAALFQGPDRSVVRYFVEGSEPRGRGCIDRLFELEPALAVMNSRFWRRCFDATDIGQVMPEERLREWNEQIDQRKTKPFTPEIVLPTLQTLAAKRWRFFAEKVDGAYRALSGDHKTNSPKGFRKRMIFANAVGYNSHTGGHVHDLRACIAKIMRRDEPENRYRTREALEWAQVHRRGEWVPMDGGSWRVRVYNNGNAHLEVHPEIAARLNDVLASLYPLAIAAEYRQRNVKAAKGFTLYCRPLPFRVLGVLATGEWVARPLGGKCTYEWSSGHRCDEYLPCRHHGARWASVADYPRGTVYRLRRDEGKAETREAERVLEGLGAARSDDAWHFDYDATDVLKELLATGVIPDQRSHQFYPTPRDLAELVVGMARIGDGHTVLEPSAGQGGLADLLPKNRTVLVEAAPLHCEVLRAKGFPRVVEADFLKWKPRRTFDRVVMNPPFSEGRWMAHLDRAAALLECDGLLVAVLPSSAKRAVVLPGWSREWHGPHAFPGTSIEVVVLVADRGSAM